VLNVNGGVFLNSKKITHLVKFQFCTLYINFWSEHISVQFDGICFSAVVLPVWTVHHNTTKNLVRATFSSVCSRHFVAQLKHLKKFLTTFSTLKTSWEMTSRLIRWPLPEPVIVRWQNVSVQWSWHDCEKFASLCDVTVVLSISMIFLHFACNSVYGSSSAHNLTYAGCTVNCQKKCS